MRIIRKHNDGDNEDAEYSNNNLALVVYEPNKKALVKCLSNQSIS